jgi:hypothetical protein
MTQPQLVPKSFWSVLSLALLALGLIVGAIMFIAPILASRKPTPPPVQVPTPAAISTRNEQFKARLAAAADVVITRSPFAPARPPKVAAPRIPATYGGPSIIGTVNDEVFFSDGTRIAKGQAANGIEILNINGPWTVELRWSGGTYTVTLVERRPINFQQSPMTRDTVFDVQRN